MPYKISPIPHSKLVKVSLRDTGKVLSKHTTLKNAAAQIRAIEYNKNKKTLI